MVADIPAGHIRRLWPAGWMAHGSTPPPRRGSIFTACVPLWTLPADLI